MAAFGIWPKRGDLQWFISETSGQQSDSCWEFISLEVTDFYYRPFNVHH